MIVIYRKDRGDYDCDAGGPSEVRIGADEVHAVWDGKLPSLQEVLGGFRRAGERLTEDRDVSDYFGEHSGSAEVAGIDGLAVAWVGPQRLETARGVIGSKSSSNAPISVTGMTMMLIAAIAESVEFSMSELQNLRPLVCARLASKDVWMAVVDEIEPFLVHGEKLRSALLWLESVLLGEGYVRAEWTPEREFVLRKCVIYSAGALDGYRWADKEFAAWRLADHLDDGPFGSSLQVTLWRE